MKFSLVFAVVIFFLNMSVNTLISAQADTKTLSTNTLPTIENETHMPTSLQECDSNTISDDKKTTINIADEPALSITQDISDTIVSFRAVISNHYGLEYGAVNFHYRKDSKAGRIESLHIQPSYRKKSYGSMLLTFALATLVECKCNIVTWLASPFNLRPGEEQKVMLPKLIAFYQKHGGVVLQQREWNADIAYYPKITKA